ncbi:MAG: response regulator transcription factor, partial [Verrucomicrobiaceae bacterium]
APATAAATSPPDVILLDVGLPGMDGIEGLRRFREAAPGTALLILTVFEDDGKILRAICAGASGYLLKTAPVEEITAAIHDVLAGGSPMNSRIARRVLTMFSQLVPAKKDYGLTAREKGILQLMVDGNIKKEIAALLDVSVHTVNTHMRHIYEKLQVHTGTKAVAKALQERLL